MNSNKKYTHIFFDLDNTLWDFKTNSRNAMKEAFKELKLDKLTEFHVFFDIYSKHNHKLWEQYRLKEVGKKDLTRFRFQHTFDELQIHGVDPDGMNELYLSEMPKQKVLFDGVIKTLEYLSSRKYQLNIITNGFKEVQIKKIESSGLEPYFNKIFISEEIKSHKPEREIFSYAIKSVNAKKTKSLMVGDDYDVDILGAIQYGIDAVLFQPDLLKIKKDTDMPCSEKGYINKIGSIVQLMYFL